MDLVPYIYCEKQEPGSMLCAQHALNNLLQSAIWSPEDLAEIARDLDSIEHSHLQDDRSAQNNSTEANNRPVKNSNCDDSGFFSVQVIDHALHRLGLRIISWRSEEMKAMHDYPEFGQSVDRWYNLNSMAEDSPKWIGPTFLSMAIAQAEAEGPQPGCLLACQADEQAHQMNQFGYALGGGGSKSSANSTTLRRPREEGTDEASRTRKRMNSETAGVGDLSYDEQIRLAIEASLSQQPSLPDKPSRTTTKGKLPISHCQTSSPPVPSIAGTILSPSTHPILPDQLGTIEDEELAAAISESLANHPSEPCNPSNSLINSNPLPPESDQLIDEPTPEELRQRRLARFS
ncbi:hypothetical protein VP01_265g17 [Puccinia sorghi]|uniref:Ataxin-3 homolog n=1 Tax=Puccinia sorghi TaxID=27349 RepID=A0A0L6V5W1_9BASI|nr:hypothetical protein VP01_265g17 [Puccinia sorghi]